MDLNKRLLIAVVLSFFILFGFSYLFPKPKPAAENNATRHNSPQTSKHTPEAPKVSEETGKDEISAPVSSAGTDTKPNARPKALVTVQTRRYTLDIDKYGRISSTVLKESKYRQNDGKPLNLIDSSRTLPLEIRFADG